MEIDQYYKFLKPENNTRVLVTGKKSIPIALYISGKAAKNNKTVESHAIISHESKIRDITEEIYIVKEKFKEHQESIEKGLPKTTFEKSEFELYKTNLKYDYLVYYSDHLEKQDLEKIIEINPKKILLHIPLNYSMPLVTGKKGLFAKKVEVKSIRQMLEQYGAKIEYYEANEKNLIILLSGLKKSFEVKQASLGEIGEKIIEKTGKYLQYTADQAGFALRSEDGEYIYYVRTEESRGTPLIYNFIFLNGRIRKESGKMRTRSKEFTIIVLPNTKSFEKELNEKGILIISKQKAVEIFREQYSPI